MKLGDDVIRKVFYERGSNLSNCFYGRFAKNSIDAMVGRCQSAFALSPLCVSPSSSPIPLSAGLTVSEGLVHTTNQIKLLRQFVDCRRIYKLRPANSGDK